MLNKKKSTSNVPMWLWAMSIVTAVGGITCGVFSGLIIGNINSINNNGGGGNVDPTPDPDPEPDPEFNPDPEPGMQWTEITNPYEAQSWVDSHHESSSAPSNATLGYDFSKTSSSDWDAAKNNLTNPYGNAKTALLTPFSADYTSWPWSDVNTKQASSANITSWYSYQATYAWNDLSSYTQTTNNPKYYRNEDSSVFKLVCNNHSPYSYYTSGARTTYIYLSSNKSDLIKFINVFESFTYSDENISNFNGNISCVIN